MSVRKRTWKTKAGETKERWIVDYKDRQKNRVMRTFSLKKEAEDFATTMKSEIRDGIHIARSKSITVAEAGKFWIDSAEANGLEHGTVVDYQRAVRMHIGPYLGDVKLAELSAPMVRAFEDQLRKDGRSPVMVRRIRGALSMLLSDAMERGSVARNVVRELKSNRRRGKERQAERRFKGKLQVGVHIPGAGRSSGHHGASHGPLAAIDIDGHVHRVAGLRITWLAVGGRRPCRKEDPRAPEGGPLPQDRTAEV